MRRRSFIAAAVAALACPVAHAAPLVRGTRSAPTGYDLNARLAAFIQEHKDVRSAAGQSSTSSFEGNLTLPAEPNVTDPGYTANSQASFDAARGNGREITLTGSFSGTLTVTGYSDMRIIIPPGVTVTRPSGQRGIVAGSTATRIEFVGTGGGRVDGSVVCSGTDIRFIGMDCRTVPGESVPSGLTSHDLSNSTRPLVLGTYFHADQWAIFAYDVVGALIVANSELGTESVSSGSPARIGSGDTALFIDSRTFGNVAGNQGIRFHGTDAGGGAQVRGGVFNCQCENTLNNVTAGPAAGYTGVNIEDIVILNNAFYVSPGPGTCMSIPETSGGNPNVTMATVAGNVGYTDEEGGAQLSLGSSPASGWIVPSTNPRNAYQAPAAWSRQ